MAKSINIHIAILGILATLFFALSPAYAEDIAMKVETVKPATSDQPTTNAEPETPKTESVEEAKESEAIKEVATKATEPVVKAVDQTGEQTESTIKTEIKAVENVEPRVQEEAEVAASTSNDIAMKTTPVKNGWVKENNQTHCYKNSQIQTGWVVNDSYKNYGLQRYWTGAYGNLVSGGKIVKTDVNGTLTYCSNAGYVARNKFKETNGNFYLADNGGALETASGWLVTGKYDGGTTQRYYLDGSTHTVRLGYFTIDGKLYFAFEDVGYVMRNSGYMNGAKFYYANNDGVISFTSTVADKVGLIWQNPELPLGCESVAITAVLRAWGFSLSKTAMNDYYIPQSSWDWVYAFAGNGRSNAINGCMAPAVVTGANRFLSEQGSSLRASNIKGTSWGDILNLVREGYPVVVWHTIDCVYPNVTDSRDGYPYYPATEHCVVVCGVSGSSVKIADSLAGMVWRDSGLFGSIYDACWQCAVVVR